MNLVSLPRVQPQQRAVPQMLILGVIACIVCIVTPFTIIDDAYISFRYAQNLAQSGELVFNLGERVEGMTNLLWTLLMALGVAAHADPEQYAIFLSLACLLWAALRLVLLGQILGAPPHASLIGAGLLLLSPHFILATTNGLEGALYAALLLELAYQYQRQRPLAAYLIAGVLFLTRPESLGIAAILTAAFFYQRRSIRPLLPGLGLLAAIVIGTTAWRIAYYGSPIPNSVVAKSLGISSLLSRSTLARLKLSFDYGWGFALGNWHLVVVALAACAWLWQARKRQGEHVGLAALCLGSILYSIGIIITNGGDWMPNFRLFMNYGTLYAALIIILIAQRWLPLWLCAILLCGPLAQTVAEVIRQPTLSVGVHIFSSVDAYYTSTLQRIAPALAPNDTISAEALGMVSYTLRDQYMHDPIGLTEPYIAQHGKPSITYGKTNIDYTLGVVRPSILIWHWGGHLKGAAPDLLAQYQIYCAAECTTWDANLVMIRNDRAEAFAPHFADWQRVLVAADGVRPWPAP